MRQIVALAVTYLRQCHLYGAATELVNRTR